MKRLLLTLISTFIIYTSYGQSIFDADISQGEKLIEAYFSPMAESFGASLNNGWYNTAKPHNLGGFDLTFTLNTVIIPKSEKTFDIGNSFGGIFTSSSSEASTIFGEKETTDMTYTNSATGLSTDFDMPKGFNTPIIPLPMIQAGIGLVKNTAIDIRFMPMLNIGDNINVNLFGAGIKHDLLQWIPGIGDAIPMSLSLQGGYTNLSTELEVAEQAIALKTQATTVNLIASKKILMVTGYAGMGYSSSTTSFSTKTDFELQGIQFPNEVKMNFESTNNLRTNIGLRFNITLVTIQADYTIAKYPTATLGIGVSFR